MSSELRRHISDTFADVFREHTHLPALPELQDDSVLLETGLDSLGFAILVIRLEEELGYDPFVLATDAYYPRTFGEFVDFYSTHKPQ
jgi:acyl carrier protein